jgi:glycosyltransferase involved in cell wall biosynthesis
VTTPHRESLRSPQGKRIAILTGASLSRNPRAFREAAAFARAGFNVVVYGAASATAQQEVDEELARSHGFVFKSVLPSDGMLKSLLLSTWRRLRVRIGVELYRYLGIENAWQLGSSIVELAKQAKMAKADYYIAHLEQAAWVGARLTRSGARVGIDMEDWYSDDLPPEARKYRPLRLIRSLEGDLLTMGTHSTCTSHVMGEALAREFGCRPPIVVYNTLPWSDRNSIDGLFKDRQDRTIPSVHWFSQTLGHGRGLEDLVAALPMLKHKAEIHLRGSPAKGFEDWLAQRMPSSWRGRVVVHGLVSNAELLSRIAEHDVGFAGETPVIPSRNLTVTNKILYYLLAGLAVVASDTAGHREVAAKAPGGVFLYPSGNAGALAARLDTLLESAHVLGEAKKAALGASERTFCWERQEKVLINSVSHALSLASALM